MLIGSSKNVEYKNLLMDGLDTTKHFSQLDEFKKQGWILFRSSPDAQQGRFRYRLKRPAFDINQEINV